MNLNKIEIDFHKVEDLETVKLQLYSTPMTPSF